MPSPTETLQTIPRTYVRTWLWFVRFPLTAAETLLRRGGDGEQRPWGPALAFDSFEAGVKQLAGTVLRDETLTEEGRVASAKVRELRRAGQLEAMADERRVEADERFDQRREQAEDRRRQTSEAADRRESELDQRREERRRQADQEAEQRAGAAERAEEATKDAIARHERGARKASVADEREALHAEREALAAKDQAKAVDDALEETKAQRRR